MNPLDQISALFINKTLHLKIIGWRQFVVSSGDMSTPNEDERLELFCKGIDRPGAGGAMVGDRNEKLSDINFVFKICGGYETFKNNKKPEDINDDSKDATWHNILRDAQQELIGFMEYRQSESRYFSEFNSEIYEEDKSVAIAYIVFRDSELERICRYFEFGKSINLNFCIDFFASEEEIDCLLRYYREEGETKFAWRGDKPLAIAKATLTWEELFTE